MNRKEMYVVKDQHGRYYVAFGGFTKELRDARVFHNLRDAAHTAGVMQDFNCMVVEVELKEVERNGKESVRHTNESRKG